MSLKPNRQIALKKKIEISLSWNESMIHHTITKCLSGFLIRGSRPIMSATRSSDIAVGMLKFTRRFEALVLGSLSTHRCFFDTISISNIDTGTARVYSSFPWNHN